jgi:hypothetical protein
VVNHHHHGPFHLLKDMPELAAGDPGTGNLIVQGDNLVRLFDKDEAVWRCYEHKRALRRLLGSRAPLSEHILDYLDWQEAERECREVGAVGFLRP